MISFGLSRLDVGCMGAPYRSEYMISSYGHAESSYFTIVCGPDVYLFVYGCVEAMLEFST